MIELLTFLVSCQHNQKMFSGHYIAVGVTSTELPILADWLDQHVGWGPVPCTAYTKETITQQWKKLAQILVADRQHRIPFQVSDDNSLMLVKLSWDVMEHYPMSEHPM